MNALDLFQLRGMGRLLRREEIAFAIAFLVDASTWGTGQLVMVDASYNTARQKR
jgi:NAD(P)-dependent dehydrogenase (short-subunit alcohol dehydrogenase family)